MRWVPCLLTALVGIAPAGGALDSASPAPPAVSFRQGSLSADQVETWLRHRPPRARLEPAAARRQRIEERVVLEVLDRRFGELGLANDPDAAGWQRLLERRLAAAETRRAVVDETKVPEAEVEAAYLADPHRFDHEQRWQLLNLFKRFPADATEAEKAPIRQVMAALRERLAGGADFAELARQESDSATRERGGAMDSAPLADLQPAVARVVAGLAPGDLSPVIETADGLTLLLCTGIVPAARPTAEAVRDRLRSSLRTARIEREWTALTGRLLAELAPVYHLPAAEEAPESVVVTVRRDPGTETLTRRDLELFLRDLRSPALSALDTGEMKQRAGELVLQLGLAREAARRGLTATDAFRERLSLESLAMRAELALAPAIRSRLDEPSEAEIAALFEQRRPRLVEPARYLLRTLEVPIRKDLPASYYELVRELGEQLAAGHLALDEARDRLAPHARLVDRGWLTAVQTWQLGRNVEVALARLEPGRMSPPVQEGRQLLVLHLVARQDERPLTLDQARPQLLAALRAARRERVRATLWAEIVAQQEIRIAP